MRRLEIDWDDLRLAFETSPAGEVSFYLGLETGKVVMVSAEVSGYLEEPPAHELPEWMQKELEIARAVEEGYGTSYIRIPQADTRQDYHDMERFIATVRDERLQARLRRAIRGRGAFRYFKDVIEDHPAERERWFAFKDRCIYEQMMDWLEESGIKPINPMEPPS